MKVYGKIGPTFFWNFKVSNYTNTVPDGYEEGSFVELRVKYYLSYFLDIPRTRNIFFESEILLYVEPCW